MSRYEDWCDGDRRNAIVDPEHPTRGTCKRCGYVGPLRRRVDSVYPHKRYDRYAPEPVAATQRCDCPTCAVGDDAWCCRTCHELAVGDA